MENFSIKSFSALDSRIVGWICELEGEIFDSPLSEAVITSELEARKDLLLQFAFDQETLCGYKLGFQHSPEIFYSWIGGIVPTYRRRGIAKILMEEQHRVLKERGYKFIRTSTKNKYREMLILNLRSGFEITGVEKKLKEAQQSILLEKAL
jgi:ribosomal protein S18 acetylase RimI-like enzyme